MSVRLTPREGSELSHTHVFDEGCVKSRFKELYEAFINKFAHEEMQKIALQAKKQFKPIPTYNYDFAKLEERFGEKAKKLAWEIIEQERRNFVESRSDYIKKTLETIIKQLRPLVWTVNEKGKPEKIKIFRETVVKTDFKGEWHKTTIEYVGHYDFETYQHINRLISRLAEFREYIPYMNEELLKLWNQANELASLEIVTVEKENAKT